MKNMIKHLCAVLLIMFFTMPAFAEKPIYTGTFSKTALSGYDTVAYFTAGEPVKGLDSFKTQYKGAAWKFSSAENLTKFQENPEQFAPQYGGYCAYAVSQNTTASSDPNQWSIVDEKLYLNYNAKIKKRWEENIAGYIAEADKNWPGLISSGK